MKHTFFLFAFALWSTTALAQQSSREFSLLGVMQTASSQREQHFTEEEAFEMSPLVVKGYIDSITEGRVIQVPYPNATFIYRTALFKVEVTEILKGTAGNYVYFEYERGIMPAEAFDQVKDMGELIFHLREGRQYPDNAVITNSPKGLMNEVDHIYALFSRDLFFRKYQGRAAPTARLPEFSLLPENTPLDSEGKPYSDPLNVRTGRINSSGEVVPLTDAAR